MTIYSIYKITNQINNKSYIGYTKLPVERRWTTHKSDAKKNTDNKFHSAIAEYGAENFILETLYQSKDGRYTHTQMEPYFINEFDTLENGYNSCPGGSGGGKTFKKKLSKEEKEQQKRYNELQEQFGKLMWQLLLEKIRTGEIEWKLP